MLARTIAFASLMSITTLAGAVEPKSAFRATSPVEAEAWQRDSRALLFKLMKIDDLQTARAAGKATAFDVKELSSEDKGKYTQKEIELQTTPTRRIKAIITLPKGVAKAPGVACSHGHGGTRKIVHDKTSIYGGFAAMLSENGFATVAIDVGQHQLADKNRTLPGERLWDFLRCIDYLASLPEVDPDRLGCAGLSLGGEMAMWMGVMDPRMKATVSSGFLTDVAEMLDRHCPCWNFPGLTDNFDMQDLFSIVAPRALMCQNGQKEQPHGGFPVDTARRVMSGIQKSYAVFGKPTNVTLDIHPGGHVFVVPTAMAFLEKHLK